MSESDSSDSVESSSESTDHGDKTRYFESFDYVTFEPYGWSQPIKKALDELLEVQRLCKGARVWQRELSKDDSDNECVSSQSSATSKSGNSFIKRKLSDFTESFMSHSRSTSPLSSQVDPELESDYSSEPDHSLQENMQQLEVLAKGKAMAKGFTEEYLTKLHQLHSSFCVLEKELREKSLLSQEVQASGISEAKASASSAMKCETEIGITEPESENLKQVGEAQRQLCMMLVDVYLVISNEGDSNCFALLSAIEFLKKAQQYGEDVSKADDRIKASFKYCVQQQLLTIDTLQEPEELGEFISIFVRLLEQIKLQDNSELLQQFYTVLAFKFTNFIDVTKSGYPACSQRRYLFDSVPNLENILKEVAQEQADCLSFEAQQVIGESESDRPYYIWIKEELRKSTDLMVLLSQLEKKIEDMAALESDDYKETEKKIKELGIYLLDKHIHRDTSAYPKQLLMVHVNNVVTLSRSVRRNRDPQSLDILSKTLAHCAVLAKDLAEKRTDTDLEILKIYQELLSESELLKERLSRKVSTKEQLSVRSEAMLKVDTVQDKARVLSTKMLKQVKAFWQTLKVDKNSWREVEPLLIQLKHLSEWKIVGESQRQEAFHLSVEMFLCTSQALRHDKKLKKIVKLEVALEECVSLTRQLMELQICESNGVEGIKALNELMVEAEKLQSRIDAIKEAKGTDACGEKSQQIEQLPILALQLSQRVMASISVTQATLVSNKRLLEESHQKLNMLAQMTMLSVDERVKATTLQMDLPSLQS
ncbi:hypothetical protein [Parashewanella tropica]|uniref:hypothetical protein n=1 Tax=Parashewanella tropica TaxID=2547970 RepID=UPI001059E882|nr:hypothetical protein [Parashewanella tropica]